jgi:hypothetical protein
MRTATDTEAISLPYLQFNRLMISASTIDPFLACIGAIRNCWFLMSS